MSLHWYFQCQFNTTQFILVFSLSIFVILYSYSEKPVIVQYVYLFDQSACVWLISHSHLHSTPHFTWILPLHARLPLPHRWRWLHLACAPACHAGEDLGLPCWAPHHFQGLTLCTGSLVPFPLRGPAHFTFWVTCKEIHRSWVNS